jgi:hypothetical protein
VSVVTEQFFPLVRRNKGLSGRGPLGSDGEHVVKEQRWEDVR